MDLTASDETNHMAACNSDAYLHAEIVAKVGPVLGAQPQQSALALVNDLQGRCQEIMVAKGASHDLLR